MRFPSFHRATAATKPGVTGRVRVDPSTRDLLRRLRPGDIAVVDAIDLDLVTAEALIAGGSAAVINLAPSVSGRYPALGAQRIVAEGIPLVDAMGRDVVGRLTDGDVVRLDGGELLIGQRLIGEGEVQTADSVAASMGAAHAGLLAQLDAFAGGARAFLAAEHELVLDGAGMPELTTAIAGRPVLVVSRGPRDAQDLTDLKQWIGERRPVLVGVGAGADVVLSAGLKPDLVIGDMEDVSDAALTSGAELVVHGYRDGRVPGLERARRHHVSPTLFLADATSEDLALLVAIHGGASLVVTAGSADDLVELLDRDRSGLTSTVFTRLRAGGLLVDARGVAQLYRSDVRPWQMFLLLVAGLVAVIVAVLVTPTGQDWLEGLMNS